MIARIYVMAMEVHNHTYQKSIIVAMIYNRESASASIQDYEQ